MAVGLTLGGWMLGTQIKATRMSDRYVSVKGLVERNVKSDLAIWPLTFKVAGDELAALHGRTEADKKAILQFLTEHGLQPNEIEIGAIRVVDTLAQEHGGGSRAPYRYVVEQVVTVRTPRVDPVAEAAQKTIELLRKGIALGGGHRRDPIYKYTALNTIKPDMITEATRNAREAADRFAADSGAKVGAIRNANQGVFSILAADSSEGFDGHGGADASLMNTVRVVTSVTYYLDN
ncbi:MAG: SIMPL domain-containing protein [Betaproteobacteria bacterium]|nr:SIMPL domain-containing protein [Betaproteobacteria bacterium]